MPRGSHERDTWQDAPGEHLSCRPRLVAAVGRHRLARVRVRAGRYERVRRIDARHLRAGAAGWEELPVRTALESALLLVDARHPGLTNDVAAWTWLQEVAPNCAIVATKIDKLARGQRIRALRELESVFDDSVLPVSAVTGEGLDDLWKLIDTLTNRKPTPPSRTPHAETAPPRHPNA